MSILTIRDEKGNVVPVPALIGKDGVSPTVNVSKVGKVTTITITDKEGTKIAIIKDGEDGTGGGGGTGASGEDGIGIASIVQTTKSTADDGINVMTITLTDGSTHTFEVQNGSRGSDGAAGKDGANGKDGTNGTPCTHSWSGTTLTVTSASGTSSANLKGDKGDKGDTGEKGADGAAGKDGTNGTNGKDGADGYSPVRGTDYWTASDKSEIVDDVLAALPIWTGGSF